MNRIAFFLLGVFMVPAAQALEIVRWERLPLAVPLLVDQERVIFVDRNVRVGIPDAARESLRVQTAGGALYLRANAPIGATRLQVQDTDTGEIILLDVTAEPALADQAGFEPMRIVSSGQPTKPMSAYPGKDSASTVTPLPVVLTRYAAQSLYAPLRTVDPVKGLTQVPARLPVSLDSLLPNVPVRAQTLAAWRLDDHWVTAVKLTNTESRWLRLDPRALQGDFVAATFQHDSLGPAGDSTDTTVVYLVTRGRGLAQALLPAISPIDASVHSSPADY